MNISNIFYYSRALGHSGDGAVHKRPHKNKTHWHNQLKSFVSVYFKVFCRIRYKTIDVLLVQCPFNYAFPPSIFNTK